MDVDIDHTWRGVYSVARSNYGHLSPVEDDTSDDADVHGPELRLSTPQLRKSVIKAQLPPLPRFLLPALLFHPRIVSRRSLPANWNLLM